MRSWHDDNVSGLSPEAKRKAIGARVLAWWDPNRRTLPWRAEPGETPDPYRVWLSEVLLQQTTAQAVAPYYGASLQSGRESRTSRPRRLEAVMSAFAGLGYYSRARNLHACAKEVAGRGRRVSERRSGASRLPGVGAYTAAAVAAIAFGRQTVPVDGNIARILARLLALEKPIAGARAEIGAAARSAGPRPSVGRFRAGAHGHRRDHLPPAQARLRALSAAPRLRRVSLREPPRPIRAAPLRRRDPTDRAPCSSLAAPTAPFSRAAGRRTACWPRPWSCRARLDRPRPVACRQARRSPRAWRRLPGEVEQVFTHFALSLAVYAARFEGGARRLFLGCSGDVARAGLSSMMRKAVLHALAQA